MATSCAKMTVDKEIKQTILEPQHIPFNILLHTALFSSMKTVLLLSCPTFNRVPYTIEKMQSSTKYY